jgi:hypothetical protein
LKNKAIISGQTTIKEILTELVKKYKFKIDTLIQNVKQDILETLKPLMFARETGLELLAAQVGNVRKTETFILLKFVLISISHVRLYWRLEI